MGSRLCCVLFLPPARGYKSIMLSIPACRALALTALALLLASSPGLAPAEQTQPRTLAVPATASWQHADTSMILPPRSAGLARGEVRDSTDAEMDVSASYVSEEDGLVATVYLYRTMTPDVALWFDRALTTIMLRPDFHLGNAQPPTPAAFARPGATTASGLRAALDVGVAEARSTALAIAPLGANWLLKIRLSSTRLERGALDERLTAFIQGLRWPAETAPAPAAVPILPCPSPLRLRNARVVRPDMNATVMDAFGGALVAQHQGTPSVYCREPGATVERGVYRPGGSTESYLIALGDSGLVLTVGHAIDLSALMGGHGPGGRISMTMQGRDDTSVYPSFDRLPPPEQALAVAHGTGATISVSSRPKP
jgi:hypothetical protein